MARELYLVMLTEVRILIGNITNKSVIAQLRTLYSVLRRYSAI